MKCISFPSLEKRPQSDACIIPFSKDETGKIAPLFEDSSLLRACHRLLETKDFKAKEGEVEVLYPDPVAERRIVVLGIGDHKNITVDTIRTSFASAARYLSQRSVSSLTVIPPVLAMIPSKIVLKACLQGLLFGLYDFREYRSLKKDEHHSPIIEIAFLTESSHMLAEIEHEVQSIMGAVSFARNLVNKNADEITPEGFASIAKSLGDAELRITVHGKEWIEQERMGLLLAVAQGARFEPRFVIAEWKGAPGDADTTVLIGKGITFDSGGLDLKTQENMLTQKEDMSGAAAVLAVMKAIRDLRLPLNVTAAIPLCENSIGSYAYKPGDVFKGRSGKTVEITSTDAEGRLILADALDYAVTTLSPSRIIDVATLTGSAEVALGNEISALFSNSDSLSFLLEKASRQAGDPVWRMPLYLPYDTLLSSDIADCKNVATRAGGAINAAVFLHGFVKIVPWAHFDIAGTAFLKTPWRYYDKGATGVPVRTLIEFLYSLLPGIIPEVEPDEEKPS